MEEDRDRKRVRESHVPIIVKKPSKIRKKIMNPQPLHCVLLLLFFFGNNHFTVQNMFYWFFISKLLAQENNNLPFCASILLKKKTKKKEETKEKDFFSTCFVGYVFFISFLKLIYSGFLKFNFFVRQWAYKKSKICKSVLKLWMPWIFWYKKSNSTLLALQNLSKKFENCKIYTGNKLAHHDVQKILKKN